MAKRAAKAVEAVEAVEERDTETEDRGRGRPAGSPNREYIAGNLRTSACPKCGCEDYKDYSTVPVNDSLQLIRTQCQNPDCGQFRLDRRPIVAAK